MKRSIRLCAVVGCVALLAGFALRSGAATIHVPADQPTIQAGIDAASYGDTVLVACGIYYEHDLIMKSGVCLRSETGTANCVTIDAQQHSGWAQVIRCTDVDDSTRLEGLTLTGGYLPDGGAMWCSGSAITLSNIIFVGNYAVTGGGLYCTDSSLTLESVEFVDNVAYHRGGGMYCENSSLTLESVEFVGNVADLQGGGMYCEDSPVTLTDCAFTGNVGDNGGGMAFIAWESGPSCALTGCTFENNISAEEAGGGLYCYTETAAVTATECVVQGNASGGCGGGMCVSASFGGSATLTDCIFVANTSSSWGGGCYVYLMGGESVLSGCTFWGNNANAGGGAHFGGGAGPVQDVMLHGSTFAENNATYGAAFAGGRCNLSNMIIAFNSGESTWSHGLLTVSCTNMYGNPDDDLWIGSPWFGVNGNISENPLFCLDENPDEPYTLQENSPCAAGNNPECGQIGAWGVGCEAVTPVEAASWGSIKAMFR